MFYMNDATMLHLAETAASKADTDRAASDSTPADPCDTSLFLRCSALCKGILRTLFSLRKTPRPKEVVK